MATRIIQTEAFAKWHKALRDRQAQQRIAIAITRLSHGHGVTKSLGGGVLEVKLTYGPGYRIYFTRRDRELIVLLCGGDKSTQQADIADAKMIAAQLE